MDDIVMGMDDIVMGMDDIVITPGVNIETIKDNIVTQSMHIQHNKEEGSAKLA